MIPKIIHYCWFGGGKANEITQQYMETWRNNHPDYEIRCWNEENFSIADAPAYVQEAYAAYKFAFVSDYVRLWALYNEGGIYFDTDVEVLRSFDDLLVLPAFIGWEQNKACTVETAVIGSEAKLPWLCQILDYYGCHHFRLADGSIDMTANPTIFTNIFEKNGLVHNGEKTVYMDSLHIFPVDYFAPLSSTRVLRVTDNTYCIHHFAGTWREYGWKDRISNFFFDKILGRRLTDKLIQIKRNIIYYLEEEE